MSTEEVTSLRRSPRWACRRLNCSWPLSGRSRAAVIDLDFFDSLVQIRRRMMQIHNIRAQWLDDARNQPQ